MIASWCRRPDTLVKLSHNEEVTWDKAPETVSEKVNGETVDTKALLNEETVDTIASYWHHQTIDKNALALGHLRTSIADSAQGASGSFKSSGSFKKSGSFKRSGSFLGPKFQLTCSLCDYSTTAMLTLDFHMLTVHKLGRGVEGREEGGAVLTSKPELKSNPWNAERQPSPHPSGPCSQASPSPGSWEQGLEMQPTAPDEDRPLAHACINFLCGDDEAQFPSASQVLQSAGSKPRVQSRILRSKVLST